MILPILTLLQSFGAAHFQSHWLEVGGTKGLLYYSNYSSVTALFYTLSTWYLNLSLSPCQVIAIAFPFIWAQPGAYLAKQDMIGYVLIGIIFLVLGKRYILFRTKLTPVLDLVDITLLGT